MALSQSFPTPNTHDPARVVVNVAVGAPGFALADLVAPMAPDPFVPEVSTPLKLTTVMDDETDCDSVAVTVMPLSGAAANARHTSDVPFCALVRTTSCHVNEPPAMLETVVVPEMASVATNASRSSFEAVVENALVAIVFAAEERSPNASASIPNADGLLVTVTVTPVAVAVLPAASRALAESVCVPLEVAVEFQAMEYGAVVTSAPVATPSSRNCTPATPTLSAAVADMVTALPVAVA